jgi:steroid delta-isomerase-like uncharacterized protein
VAVREASGISAASGVSKAGGASEGRVPLSEAFARDFAERWQVAWNTRRADEVTALCTEDVVWGDPLTERPERGKAAVRAYLESVWATFPDLNFTWPEGPFSSYDGTNLACHWRVTGTMLGPADPGFAPTGKRLHADGVDLLELRDGLVCNYVGFFDARSMAQQIGVLPPSGSRAEQVAVKLQRLGARIGKRGR